MATLFGRPTAAARAYLGSLGQVARLDSFVEADGPARGARRLRMVTGGGLEVDIHPDRALDIGQVTVDGIPVAWIETGGMRGPALIGPHGDAWLRTWGGGMLTTCGLDAYGSPSTDAGQDFGQHGRISGTPSTVTTSSAEGGSIVVEGVVRQSVVGGESLTMRRRIESEVGSASLTISDVVTNEGARDAVHMILYHANFGWPLVEEGTLLTLPSAAVEARGDPDSVERAASWADIEPPSVDNPPQVFLHDFAGDTQVTVRLENPRIGLAMRLEFDRRQLPWLCEWKLLAERTYVLGLEPMNTRTITSRAAAQTPAPPARSGPWLPEDRPRTSFGSLSNAPASRARRQRHRCPSETEQRPTRIGYCQTRCSSYTTFVLRPRTEGHRAGRTAGTDESVGAASTPVAHGHRSKSRGMPS